VEMYMEVKGERLGVLTPRALKNLSKLVHATTSLMFNQSDAVLNALFQRQLAEINTVSVLHDPSAMDCIVSIFRTGTYQPYDKLLESIKDDIIRFDGDILENDALSFTTGVGELDDSIIYGIQCTLSANGMARSTFSSALYRLSCGNAAINKVYQAATIKEVSPGIVLSLEREFNEKHLAYEAEVGEVLNFMRATPVNQTTHWHVLDSMKMPKKLVDRYKDTVRDPETYCDVVQGAKAGGVETVYDSFNILTHLAKDLPLASARARSEAIAFSWAADLYAMSIA
jgi:hypothetical protein